MDPGKKESVTTQIHQIYIRAYRSRSGVRSLRRSGRADMGIGHVVQMHWPARNVAG